MSQNLETIAKLDAAIELLTKARNDMQNRHNETAALLAAYGQKAVSLEDAIRNFLRSMVRK